MFMPCWAWICDHFISLVSLLLSNQRLLECSCFVYVYPMLCMDLWPLDIFGLNAFVQQEVVGMFLWRCRDRHFKCFGDMCSLPSHPCHCSCYCSCCDVLLTLLLLFWVCSNLYKVRLLTNWWVGYFWIFSNQRLLEGFILSYKNVHVTFFGYMGNLECHISRSLWA